MKLLVLFLLVFNVFAGDSYQVSIDDDIISIPVEYSKSKLSEKESQNMKCMLEFLGDILKSDSKEENLFKTLKSSGYSLQVTIDRYNSKSQIQSQSDPLVVKRVEKTLRKYAQKIGLKGKDVLTQIYKKITIGEEIEAAGQFYDDLTFETGLNFDELREFTEDFAVRRQNQKLKRQKDSIVTSLENGLLKVKIPDIQNKWCNSGSLRSRKRELEGKVNKAVLKDISPKMMKYYERIVKFLNTKFKSPTEKCLEEENLNKLRNRLFKGYKFHERGGWILDPDGRRVYNEKLKADLYNYFYEKRRGLLKGESEGRTDHIVPGSMINYVVKYSGEGDKRKRCLVGTEYRDRLGKIVQIKGGKICAYIKQKGKVEVEPSKVCPAGQYFNPEKRECRKIVFCPQGSFLNLITEKCDATKACNDDEMFNMYKGECVTAFECQDGEVINYITNECMEEKKCENGFYDPVGDKCVTFPVLKECPQGERFDYQQDKCIEIKRCGENEYLDYNDQKCHTVKACGFDEILLQGECRKQSICDSGEIFVSYRNRCELPINCNSNQYFNRIKNRCENMPDNPPSIDDGYGCNENERFDFMTGKCEKPCPWGTRRIKGECKKVKTCPSPYYYDFEKDTCVKMSY